MKIHGNWRTRLLAVLALVACQAGAQGQAPYGQPYGAAPQMVYAPGPVAYGYNPGMMGPGMPYAAPGAPYYPTADISVGDDAPSSGDDSGDYLLSNGYTVTPLGQHLAAMLGALAPYSETGCCAPHWFDVHAEAVFLNRNDKAAFRELVRLGPLGSALITTDDLDFDTFNASMRITGTWQTGPGSNLEFTYFGLNEYSKKAEARSNDNLLYAAFDNFSVDANGFPDSAAEIEQLHQARYQRVKLDSDFDSLELNYRRRWMGPNCLVQGSWLVGVRYFELKDRMQFYSFAERDTLQPPGPDSGGEAWYDLRTRNYMTGAQLGGDAWLCLLPGLRIGLDVKAGIYGNNVKSNTNMWGHDPFDNFVGFINPEALGNDKVSFIGELGLMFTYQFTHSLTFRGGYQMMWVEGVATALDNFNPDIIDRTPMLADGDQLFYNGFNVGFEWMW